MKIAAPKTVTFASLKRGDLFRDPADSEVWMKVKANNDCLDPHKSSAVNMADGANSAWTDYSRVVPLAAELVLL